MKQLLTSLKKVALKAIQGYDDLCRKAHITRMMVLGMLVSASPELSYATTPTIGDVGDNAGNQAAGLTSGLLRLAGFIGLSMVVLAFVKGRTAKQQGESIGGFVALGIIGALLLSIPIVVSIVNVSLLGSDASTTIQGQIIK